MAGVVAHIEVRHHRFTTQLSYDAFDQIITDQAADGFGLIRIVPVDDVFSVAVFERTVPSEPGSPAKR